MITTAPKNNKARKYQLTAFVLAIFFVSGASGLSIVWMRNQIESYAYKQRMAERESAQLAQRINTLDSDIAKAHNPDYLNRRIAELRLDLGPAKDGQVVRLKQKAQAPVYYSDFEINVTPVRYESEANPRIVIYRPEDYR